jgi:hypothetical protein
MGCRVLKSAEDAVQVDVEDSLEGNFIGLPHSLIRRNPGIGEDEVDAVHDLGAVIDRRPQCDAIANVGFPPGRGGAQVIRDGAQAIWLKSDQGYMSASGSGTTCHVFADAARGSGDY